MTTTASPAYAQPSLLAGELRRGAGTAEFRSPYSGEPVGRAALGVLER
jgi:hypothetical protein